MIGLIIFIVVYILSVWACNKLNNLSGEEESSLNYFPLVNTLAVILTFTIAIIWAFVEWLRHLGRK